MRWMPLPDMEHGEHLDDDGVSRVGQTTFKHLFFSDPYGAWVFKDEAVTVFADHYSSSAVVVGVDEAVGEGFTNSFVPGRVIDAVKSLKTEWNLEILDYAGDYAAVEIENIAAPVS